MFLSKGRLLILVECIVTGFFDKAICKSMQQHRAADLRKKQGLDFDTWAVQVSVVYPQSSTHSMEISQAIVISADRIVNNGAVASGGGCAATRHREAWLICRRARRMDKLADDSTTGTVCDKLPNLSLCVFVWCGVVVHRSG